jgi:hypothetical protein
MTPSLHIHHHHRRRRLSSPETPIPVKSHETAQTSYSTPVQVLISPAVRATATKKWLLTAWLSDQQTKQYHGRKKSCTVQYQ